MFCNAMVLYKQVKIWNLPDDENVDSISNPLCSVLQNEQRVESVTWNPVADNILSLSTRQAITIVDVNNQSSLIS